MGVQLLFPSEETFLRTNTISVDVFDGEGSGDQGADAICRALSVETSVAPTGVQALASAPATEACFVQEGGVRFEQVPVGRRVFFAEAVAADATPLLRGCTVADVYAAEDGDAQAATVEVQMATLPGYPDGTALLCESITAKCEERRPCVE